MGAADSLIGAALAPSPYAELRNIMSQVLGYRELTTEELKLINQVKQLGNEMLKLIEHLENKPGIVDVGPGSIALSVDKRWVAIGKTHLQQGFMALTRSVAKPNGL